MQAIRTTNPRVLIVTPEVSYLLHGMGKIANYLAAKAGGLVDVSAALISFLFEEGANVHVAIPDYRFLYNWHLPPKKGGFNMLARKDKRMDERFVSNAPINFSFFSTRFWHEYPSITRNHSNYGMCFESNHPLTPGTNLFIRLDKHPMSNSDSKPAVRLRTSTLAAVKWCRKLSDKHKTCYCVGVKYY